VITVAEAKVTKPRAPKPPTPRQVEIARLVEIGRDKRTDQQGARLQQLRKEEHRANFLRIAPKRTQNVLVAMERLANVGERSLYDYTEDEARKIVEALRMKTAAVEAAFSKRKEERSLFSF
jgi:hypothetical protein